MGETFKKAEREDISDERQLISEKRRGGEILHSTRRNVRGMKRQEQPKSVFEESNPGRPYPSCQGVGSSRCANTGSLNFLNIACFNHQEPLD